MAFNFEAAIKEAEKSSTENLVSAIVLGPSGAGKSSIMGTFGVKTLYLYTSGESHGPLAARTLGGNNIIGVCIDQDNGATLGPDAAYARLLNILGDLDGIKKLGVKAVTLDGASEIEAIIRATEKWKQLCLSANGKHNGFAEPAATISLLRPVLNLLRDLQTRLGVHFAMSCILDVKDVGPDGAILEAVPRLVGYSVAEMLIQQFADVLVVGRMTKNDVAKHKIQFMSDVNKVSKDQVGNVKKAINFAPRVAGVLVNQLPPIMDADLSQVIKLKQKDLQ